MAKASGLSQSTVSQMRTWFLLLPLLVHCLKNGIRAADLLEDGLDGGGPDEGLGVGVVGGEERFDRRDEVGDAVEDGAADGLVGEFAKPVLDEVEPGAPGRGEVQVEARVPGEPSVDVAVRVGAVVVDDQMQLAVTGELAIEEAQELQELLMAVPRQALADDAAVERAERGEQGRRAVALVVMGHRAGATALDREARLGAIQGLDLALLINAQHDRLLRRVEVEPDDVGQLLAEPRIVRQLEGADTVRLQAVSVPDALYGGRPGPWRCGSSSASAPAAWSASSRARSP